ncbi:MAG: nucleotidyltransferase family protein [Acidobacteriota bacterium]|nr:nucleotidyltransferase family protein [Acidobacteriota bacterium]
MKSLVELILDIGRMMDEMSIPYIVVGSVASSLYGDARATADVDIVVDLQADHISGMLAALESDFYVDEQAVRRAVENRRSFNAIHFESLFKIDVYILPADPFAQQQIKRRRTEKLLPNAEQTISVASPEDTLLAKLRWYRQGGGVSSRQLSDVVGILKVQGARIDVDYLREWAAKLNVLDLLEQVLNEARDSA